MDAKTEKRSAKVLCSKVIRLAKDSSRAGQYLNIRKQGKLENIAKNLVWLWGEEREDKW